MLSSSDIVAKYLSFFEKRGHKRIANAPLVPINDPTTLFTSSGMQALIPYLLGETHSQGTRLVNIQNCLRAQDIEEVGNNRHTTFFRMIGNWSLGDYFKAEQIPWFWEFLTKELELDPQKLYVTVFSGYGDIPKDTESEEIWKKILPDSGLDPKERIHYYGAEKNWWSRAGVPENMPAGEPGGPDSEVFYEFTSIDHDPKFGEKCHPNCDCGRFMEIGNSVFMQYIKKDDGTFGELPKKNVDFGGGLERLAAAVNDDPDVFKTDLYSEIIKSVEEFSDKKYENEHKTSMRVIADHLKAATFLMVDGVTPSNKERGYVLRRLLRRAAVKMHQLNGGLSPIPGFQSICDAVLRTEEPIDEKIDRKRDQDIIYPIIEDELGKFVKSLDKGLKVFEKTDDVTGKVAFDLYQTYGFPVEITSELVAQRGQTLDTHEFKKESEKHQELSRTASAGMFKGGLADHSEKTIMGHTATHLMHQALRDVLGNSVHQTGSNITSERVRFDFNYDKRLTDEEIARVEEIVNKKITENLPVHFELINTDEAHKMGAIGLFMDTYGEKSKIYFIGDTSKAYKNAYSIEFCGGPHVDFTGAVKSFKIIKQENLGKNQKRLYAVIG